MVPLILTTFGFQWYIQEHFRAAEYLPARQCIRTDIRREGNFEYDFLKDAYLQPELKEPEVLPDVHNQELPEALRDNLSEYGSIEFRSSQHTAEPRVLSLGAGTLYKEQAR